MANRSAQYSQKLLHQHSTEQLWQIAEPQSDTSRLLACRTVQRLRSTSENARSCRMPSRAKATRREGRKVGESVFSKVITAGFETIFVSP
jgi:hypothetical protein